MVEQQCGARRRGFKAWIKCSDRATAKGTFLVIAYSQGVSQSAIDAAWGGGGQDRPRQRTQCNSHELKTLVPSPLNEYTAYGTGLC